MTGRVCDMKPADRRAHLRSFTGQLVTITYSGLRGAAAEGSTMIGTLVCVANPLTGSQADVVVMQRTGYHPQALSAATILSIGPAPVGAHLVAIDEQLKAGAALRAALEAAGQQAIDGGGQ